MSPSKGSSSTHYHRHGFGGFTLTELLIVITLIVIILGIAIPTLSTLTGSRSTESGKNQLSAMLGRARNLAIQNVTTVGVAIYVDPATGRTGMALVQMITLSGPTAYQAWTFAPGGTPAYPIDGPGIQYQQGDVVFRLADFGANIPNDPQEFLPSSATGKKTVKTFVCTQFPCRCPPMAV